MADQGGGAEGDDVQSALRYVIDNYGAQGLSSETVLGNVMSDLLPDSPRESSLLLLAARADVAGVLGQHLGQQMDPDTAVRLTSSAMAESSPVAPEACLWVTAEIARALGHAVSAGGSVAPVSQPPTVAPTTPASQPPGAPGFSAAPTAAAPGSWPPPSNPAAPPPMSPGAPPSSWPPQGGPGPDQGTAAAPGGPSSWPPQGGTGANPGTGAGQASWPPQGGPATAAQGWGPQGQPPSDPSGAWGAQAPPPQAGGWGPQAGGVPPGTAAPAPKKRGSGFKASMAVLVVVVLVIVYFIIAAAAKLPPLSKSASPTTATTPVPTTPGPTPTTPDTVPQVAQLSLPNLMPYSTLLNPAGYALSSCDNSPSFSGLNFTGLSDNLTCKSLPEYPGWTLYGFKFDSLADYQAGLKLYNGTNALSFNASTAQSQCPATADTDQGLQGWHSGSYPSIPGEQFIECLQTFNTQNQAQSTYVWTAPTEHAFFEIDAAPGVAFTAVDQWWTSYGVPAAP